MAGRVGSASCLLLPLAIFLFLFWDLSCGYSVLFLRILESSLELVTHLTQDSRGEPAFAFLDVTVNSRGVLGRQCAQSPGHTLHDHIVAVIDQQIAHHERAPGIAEPASGGYVESDRRHKGRSPTPAICRVCPGSDLEIWHASFTP